MTDNDKSYEQKHSKENKDMWKANGERVAFLYKKLERDFLEMRRLSRDPKEGHTDEMHSYLQST